jgi:hypothetical protein
MSDIATACRLTLLRLMASISNIPCRPVLTYAGRGVEKQGVVKSQHAIIYSTREPPSARSGELPQRDEDGEVEAGMRPPIQVTLSSKTAQELDPMMRVNYAKMYSVEHYVKAHEVGDVHPRSMARFVNTWNAVWRELDLDEYDEESISDEETKIHWVGGGYGGGCFGHNSLKGNISIKADNTREADTKHEADIKRAADTKQEADTTNLNSAFDADAAAKAEAISLVNPMHQANLQREDVPALQTSSGLGAGTKFDVNDQTKAAAPSASSGETAHLISADTESPYSTYTSRLRRGYHSGPSGIIYEFSTKQPRIDASASARNPLSAITKHDPGFVQIPEASLDPWTKQLPYMLQRLMAEPPSEGSSPEQGKIVSERGEPTILEEVTSLDPIPRTSLNHQSTSISPTRQQPAVLPPTTGTELDEKNSWIGENEDSVDSEAWTDYESVPEWEIPRTPQFTLMKQVSAALLQRFYQTGPPCGRAHDGSGNGCTDGHSASGDGSKSGDGSNSSLPSNSGLSGEQNGKRKRKQQGLPDGDGEDHRNVRPKGPDAILSDDTNRLWACPFLKNGPRRFRACRRFELRDVSRVKQHLLRDHQEPIHCPRCFQTFKKEAHRDDHIRQSVRCDVKDRVEWHCVNPDQKKLLRNRSDRKKTAEGQWYDIYTILFGSDNRPDSPYLDDVESEELRQVRAVGLREGPAFVQQLMLDLPENLRPQQEDIHALVESAVQDFLATVIDIQQAEQRESEIMAESGERGANQRSPEPERCGTDQQQLTPSSSDTGRQVPADAQNPTRSLVSQGNSAEGLLNQRPAVLTPDWHSHPVGDLPQRPPDSGLPWLDSGASQEATAQPHSSACEHDTLFDDLSANPVWENPGRPHCNVCRTPMDPMLDGSYRCEICSVWS